MKKNIKYNVIESLKKSGPPVIIVAATHEAEAIANSCRENKIFVEAICDSEKRKTEKNYCGVKTIHTPLLKSFFSEARFIIASQHIQECASQLEEMGYNEFYSCLELLENYDVNKHTHKISQEYMVSRIEVCKKSHQYYFDDSKTYMRSLDVMVTTKCSLKCSNCSNLMQYYTNAKDTSQAEILEAIKILNKNVDYISEFRVIGGEPLMNKGWADVVNGISNLNPKAKIFVYTNATILPKDNQLESFVGKKVNFTITDYGKLSKNSDKMVERLKNFNISYDRQPAEDWTDCSRIIHHKRSIKGLEEVFKQCCVKYIYTLLNGKLYRCPFIANADNLKAIPNNPYNYVNLMSNNKNLKEDLERLIKNSKFFPGCDFCDGRPYDPSSKLGYDGKGMIPAGEQLSQPKPYKIYN